MRANTQGKEEDEDEDRTLIVIETSAVREKISECATYRVVLDLGMHASSSIIIVVWRCCRWLERYYEAGTHGKETSVRRIDQPTILHRCCKDADV